MLLKEIQNDLVKQNTNLSSILRKAVILSYELKNEELKNWVGLELNGYSELNKNYHELLPSYRIIKTQSYGNFSGSFGRAIRNAPIPMGNFPEEVREFATTIYLIDSIREIESLIKRSSGENIMYPWSPDLVVPISESIYEGYICMQAWKVIGVSILEGILDTVRNRLLMFLMEIEGISQDRDLEGVEQTKIDELFVKYISGK